MPKTVNNLQIVPYRRTVCYSKSTGNPVGETHRRRCPKGQVRRRPGGRTQKMRAANVLKKGYIRKCYDKRTGQKKYSENKSRCPKGTTYMSKKRRHSLRTQAFGLN